MSMPGRGYDVEATVRPRLPRPYDQNPYDQDPYDQGPYDQGPCAQRRAEGGRDAC